MEAPVSLWCGVLFGWFLVNTDWIFELFCAVSRSQMNLWLVKMVAPACQIFILFLFFSPQLGQEGIKNYFSSGSRLDHGPANKHEQLSRDRPRGRKRVGDTWPVTWQPRGRDVTGLLVLAASPKAHKVVVSVMQPQSPAMFEHLPFSVSSTLECSAALIPRCTFISEFGTTDVSECLRGFFCQVLQRVWGVCISVQLLDPQIKVCR